MGGGRGEAKQIFIGPVAHVTPVSQYNTIHLFFVLYCMYEITGWHDETIMNISETRETSSGFDFKRSSFRVSFCM